MSTHFTRPDAGDARAPFPIVSRDVTRYRSAAEICAAINAAAADAPEFSDACYAPGAADWHGPTRGASFAHFLYCIDGARGSYSVSNTRENLLTLARKVNTIRAAFDGKPRRAPAAKRAPTSAPHVAARALMADGNARDAIQLAENSGAVFFGAAAIGAPGVPYMGCETVEFFGQSFTIGRAIKTGRFLVLHTSTALSVSGSAHRDGFKAHSAALDWIETESACDAWREKFLTALHGRSAFDQTAARARYFEDETAPVETIEPAPVESAPAETAPDVPIEQPAAPVIEQPAPVDVWPPLQPMMRPAEHIARLPLFARLAIERIDADSDLRTGAKLDELLRAYAAQYRETCDDYTRQSAHAIASRRFWNFRPDDAPTEPAAIVPAADPAPVCEPVESPALQATRAHPWMTHAARRVYWVQCQTARVSRNIGPLPAGGMFRRPRSAGFMPEFLMPEVCAHRAAVAAAVRADRAAKRAPVDPAPRADAAPVDTGAAPGGWMRPATGMLSESETRAWPSAEPVESAPTPGYAFPADALPATHSDAAPVDPDEQQTGETVETWFERIRRESAEKRARIAELADTVAAGSGSIGFTHPSDPARYGIAGPDMSGRGAFRFTYFDAAGPIGDAIRPSLADAIAAGIEYGFTVDAAPLEWPENPEPAPVPVPVPGKFETFASLSDVDLRRYIEGCHIARQFGIDFEHAAQELNDRKERGTWSNPGAPVATHSEPIPAPTHSATHPDVFNVFNVWQELRAGRADPTEYQAHVLECVAAAKADGLFYNSEVWPRAAALMADRFGYPDARSAGADNGVAREFGTHCYCAGDVLSARHKAELNRTAAAGFRAGQVFPRLIFNDGKNVTGARLSSMSHTGESCKLTGKRGRYSVEFECEAYSLQCAIERAAERAGILAKRRGDAKPRAPIAPAPVPGDTKAEPVPADTLPADTAPTYVDVFADGFGFYCYSLRDGSKWTGRPSFEAAATELAGMGMQARAAGLNPPVPADTAPDDDTIPAPLDGLDVIETADAETLAEFDRLSRAPGVAPLATDARPIPSGPVLRIPAGDLRARIPARFAPAYLLTA